MVLPRALTAAVEAQLGQRISAARPVAGGDINQAAALELEGGEKVFLKWNPQAPAAMFAAEAHGLAWLAAAQALRAPEVLAVSAADEAVPFLVLEWLPPGRPGPDFDERLGHGLAALHRAGAPGFGLEQDNYIGSLPQANTPASTWAEFYALRRLEPQWRRAVDQGLASPAMRRGFERLWARLPELVGPNEPPARLHGDLWGGNLYVDDSGQPCLIDPAVYGGHREVDLAMMRLFGGFAERVFAAYAEAYPLAPGAEQRVGLYQLYPLLVHLNLFGGSYAAAIERVLSRYV